jgi:hypothetical protein
MATSNEPLRVGDNVDGYCTRCKIDLNHTIEALDAEGQIARVHCNTCGSQHNYHRPRSDSASRSTSPSYQTPAAPFSSDDRAHTTPIEPPRSTPDDVSAPALKAALREVLREELGLGHVEMGDRWTGGEVVIKPGRAGLQEKVVPIDSLFHKIVMIRDRLRVLEQRINSNPKLTDEEKVALQQYITGCYGSLTTFNFLFKYKEDWFAGSKDPSARGE